MVVNPVNDGLDVPPSLEAPEVIHNDVNPHDVLDISADNLEAPVVQEPSDPSDAQAAVALGEQLQEVLSDKQKLIEELTAERVKNSQLENQLAQGIIALLTSI